MSDAGARDASQQTPERESSGCGRRHRLFPRSLSVPVAGAACRINGFEPRSACVHRTTYCSLQARDVSADVLKPLVIGEGAIDAERFDSVGINYLLHCIPGSIDTKAVAFDHLKALMNPNAVLFGSTLLQGVRRSGLAKRLMAVYNKKGISANEHDDLEGLERALRSRFRDVSVQVVGCGALFSGRV